MEQIFTLNEKRNVTLTAMIQPIYPEIPYVKKRPAVLILPGGAYRYCSDREAEPIAYSYLRAGFNAFVLRYSVGDHFQWPYPLEDYEQAMSFIRNHAKEWNISTDKIAVIGFSAGGHLASMAATIAENKPAAAVLCYPATKSESWLPFVKIPDGPKSVNTETCPCFLFMTRNDSTVSVDNAIDFENELVNHGIQFESHIYSYGPHGLSTCDSSIQIRDGSFTPRAERWIDDSIGWLREIMGDFGPDGITSPVCRAHINADHEKTLSMHCSLKYLLRLTAENEVVSALYSRISELIKKLSASLNIDFTTEEYLSLCRGETVYNFCIRVGMSKEEAERFDQQLRKIKNPL